MNIMAMMERIRSFSTSSVPKVVVIMVLGLTIGKTYFEEIRTPPFSPDSWSYFEAAKTIFNDFYHVNTVRCYSQSLDNEYSTSFPPLFPVLVAIINSVFHLGIYSGYNLNFLVLLMLLGLCLMLARRIEGRDGFWTGIILFCSLLWNPYFMNEVTAARSIPLAVLFQILILTILLEPGRITLRKTHLIAVCAGLSVLTRFDFMLSSLALGCVLFVLAEKCRVASLLVYIAVLAVTVSPWFAYSYLRHHAFWVSDNSRTVMMADRTLVLDYFPPGEHPGTILDHPEQWVSTHQAGLYAVLESFCRVFIGPVFWSSFALVFLVYILHEKGKKLRVFCDAKAIRLALFPVVYICQLAAVGLSGYTDERYFSGMYFFYFLGVLYIAANTVILSRDRLERRLNWVPVLIPIVVILYIVAHFNYGAWAQIARNVRYTPANHFYLSGAKYGPLVSEMRKAHLKPVLLILDSIDEYEFGGLTGVKTMCRPSNLSMKNILPFLRELNPTHVYARDTTLLRMCGIMPKPTEVENLYLLGDSGKHTNVMDKGVAFE